MFPQQTRTIVYLKSVYFSNFNVCMFLSLFIDSGKIPPSSFTNVFFLAHLAKGNVNFCHHLSSVVRYFSPFNFLL